MWDGITHLLPWTYPQQTPMEPSAKKEPSANKEPSTNEGNDENYIRRHINPDDSAAAKKKVQTYSSITATIPVINTRIEITTSYWGVLDYLPSALAYPQNQPQKSINQSSAEKSYQTLAPARRPENKAHNYSMENREYRIVTCEQRINGKLQRELKAAQQYVLPPKAGWKHAADFQAANIFSQQFDEKITQEELKQNNVKVILKHPKDKHKTKLQYETVSYPQTGMAMCQGRRKTMEDALLASQLSISLAGREYLIDITGIFDGHSGTEWSQYAREHISSHIKKRLEEFNQNGLCVVGIWNALKIAFVDLNLELSSKYPLLEKVQNTTSRQTTDFEAVDFNQSGTTANVALRIHGGDLWIANLGDSRAILLNQKNGRTTQISEDAVPKQEKYQRSLKKRQGSVVDGWVSIEKYNRQLAIARSLGDHSFNGAISARPKITMIPCADLEKRVLIQTSDGIPEIAESIDIGSKVLGYLKANNPPALAAAKLVASAYEAGSGDNLSAMVTILSTKMP